MISCHSFASKYRGVWLCPFAAARECDWQGGAAPDKIDLAVMLLQILMGITNNHSILRVEPGILLSNLRHPLHSSHLYALPQAAIATKSSV